VTLQPGKRGLRCEHCPLGLGPAAGSRGPEDAAIVICGEAPGANELRDGIPFIGEAGKLLSKVLVRTGIDESQVFITNAMRCRPPVGKPPGPEYINACKPRLLAEVTSHPRSLILALGNSAIKALTGNFGLKITQERGRARTLTLNGMEFLTVPTYHPAAILRSPGDMPKLLEDVKYAAGLLKEGGRVRTPGVVQYVVSTPDSVDADADFLLQQEIVACDIETAGFNPRRDRILCISFTWTPNRAYVFPEEVLDHPAVLRLFTTIGPRWVYFNGKFDASFIRGRLGKTQRRTEANGRPRESRPIAQAVLSASRGREAGTQRVLRRPQASVPGNGNQAQDGEAGVLASPAGNGAHKPVLVGRYVRRPGGGLRFVREYRTDLEPVRSVGHRSRPPDGEDQGDSLPAMQHGSGTDIRQSGAGGGFVSLPEVRVDEDAMLLHYLLSEGNREPHGLKDLAGDMLGADPNYDQMVKKFAPKMSDSYADVPKEILYQYAAMDTDHTFQIYTRLKAKLCSPRYQSMAWAYENIMIPASRLLQDVERYGVWVDKPTISRLSRELEADLAEREAVLQQVARENGLWDPVAYAEWKGPSAKVPDAFKPSSPYHLLYIFRRLGLEPRDPRTKKVSTNVEALRGLPKSPFVDALVALRKAAKLLSTYVDGVWKVIDDDGRVHSTFLLHGTATGRLSSRNPNMQNIPREARIRDIFQAPPGRVLVELDYSQVELRVLAYLSGDPALQRVYEEGRDLHDEVSEALFPGWHTYKDTVRGKEERIRAKFVNFGIAYGRGAESLMAEFKTMSLPEAKSMINGWWAAFPQAHGFVQRSRAASRSGTPLQTPFGRRRSFSLVTNSNRNALENEAANFPIQCLPPGQKVWTRTGHRPIEVIEPGDEVMTSRGFRSVLDTWTREVDTRQVTLRVAGCQDVTFTENHPVWIQRQGAWTWKPAAEVVPGDRVSVPKYADESLREIDGLPLTQELANFLGWYLAEGSTDARGSVRLTLHEDEVHYARRLAMDLESEILPRFTSYALKPKAQIVRPNKRSKAITVRTGSRKLATWLRQNFSTSARTKSIPEWVFRTPRQFAEQFLASYARGDGTDRSNGWVVFTQSETLAFDVQRLLNKLGVCVRITRRAADFGYPTLAPWHYRVSFPWSSDPQKLITKVDDAFICTVETVTVTQYNGPVHNLHVADVEEFCVPYVTHNSTASDLTLLSAISLNPQLLPYNAHVVNLVHDSILIEADEATAPTVAGLAREVMMDTPRYYLQTGMPFEVSSGIAKSWGALK
jgi:uracil-DNA glycosylase family 4